MEKMELPIETKVIEHNGKRIIKQRYGRIPTTMKTADEYDVKTLNPNDIVALVADQ